MIEAKSPRQTEVRIEDMAMLIRRLCRALGKYDLGSKARAQALDFLHRKGLGGSPLRKAETIHDPTITAQDIHETMPPVDAYGR